MLKFPDQFDLLVENVKSRTTSKVSVFVLHIVNKQSNHPKTKAWKIIFIIQWIYIYKGIIIYRETSMKNSTLFP